MFAINTVIATEPIFLRLGMHYLRSLDAKHMQMDLIIVVQFFIYSGYVLQAFYLKYGTDLRG